MTPPPSSPSLLPPARRDEELVFNTRLAEPMLRHFEERFGPAALDALVRDTDTPLTLLRDHEQWMSTKQLLRLANAMVERSGDTLITYRAGLELLHPSVLGPTWYVMRALGSPEMVYERMTEFTDLSRITHWKRVEGSDRHVVLRFEVERGHDDDPLFCLNRQGGLAGVPRVFDLPLARVTHPACIHEGAAHCEYRVEWIPPPWGLGLIPWLALAAVVVTLAVAVAQGPGSSAALVAAMVSVALLGANGALLQRRNAQVAVDQRDQLVATKALLDENLQRNRERLLLEKVDQLTRREVDRATLLDTALGAICNTLGYDRAMFLTADRAQGKLRFTLGVGFDEESLGRLRSLSLQLDNERDDEWLFANLLQSESGALVADVSTFRARLTPPNQRLLDDLGSHTFVAVPVRGPDAPLGLLVVDQVDPDRTLGERDHRMLQQVGNLVGLALANADLVGSLRRERHVLQNALLLNQKISQYLPRSVVDRVSLDPEAALKLGGQRRRAAVLFSDIVGFTQWSERVEPESVVTFLNWYFEAMDQVVEGHHGILDKRIGDGMMVVFLEAEGREAPARRALRCGLRMQARIAELHEEAGRPREDAFRVRVGVSYGEPVSGNIGSVLRLEYTVIGDTVNVASRMEGRCEPGSVLATEQAMLAAGEGVRAEARGELTVKGRSQPVVAYEILGVG